MTYVVFTPYKNGKMTSPRAVFTNKKRATSYARTIGFKSFVADASELEKYAR